MCHCHDCQVHHSHCGLGAGAALKKPNHCNQWLMRCVQHAGNSNHYLACRRTKPQEAIDYLFDMLLKPGGQEEKGTRTEKKKKRIQSSELTKTDRNQTCHAQTLIKLSVFVCVLCVCENQTQGRQKNGHCKITVISIL